MIATEIVEPTVQDLDYLDPVHPLRKQRNLSQTDWINTHGSGTLKKNAFIGSAIRDMYLQERVAYEFGWEFFLIPSTGISVSKVKAAGDCRGITEFGWHAERYLSRNPFREDIFKPCWVSATASRKSGTFLIEGAGIVCLATSAKWIPKGHVVACVISVWDPDNNNFHSTNNPF